VAVSICIVGIGLSSVGVLNQSLAYNIPILGNMLQMIEDALNNNDLYDSYTDVNKSFSRNGLTVKVGKVVYSKNQIFMDLELKTDKPFKESKYAKALTYDNRKEYVDFLLQREKAYCKVLKNMVAQISKIDDEIDRSRVLKKLNKLSGRGIDLQKIYWTDAEYEWARAEFESNPYNSEALKYMTTKGVKVRSKSERIIGNKLEEYNLPYRYESKIIIDGKVYYPDFVIMCPDGSLVIWEHLGLMDDERYKMNAFVKIAEYRKLGYVQHKNLVCTWEEDLEDMNTIDEIIQRFILKMPV